MTSVSTPAQDATALADIADEIEQSDGLMLMLTGGPRQLGIKRSAMVVAAVRAQALAAETQECVKCGVRKALADYSKWMRRGKISISAQCRDCRNAYYRQPAAKARANERHANQRGTTSRKQADIVHDKNRRERYPERERAKRAVRTAIESGEMKRPEVCSLCEIKPPLQRGGRSGIQAHHSDYSKPLDVIWLCHACHVKQHSEGRT